MNATAAKATSGWRYGGQRPPNLAPAPTQLGDIQPSHIRQGLAAISAAGKEARALGEAASDATARIVGLHVDATGDEGIKVDLVVARGGARQQQQFVLATLSGPLLKQLVQKAIKDRSDMLLVEPASMLAEIGLLAEGDGESDTATADRFTGAVCPKAQRQDG
jgi:hypothetical protein